MDTKPSITLKSKDYEKQMLLRKSILGAELERLSGAPTYSVEEVRKILKETQNGNPLVKCG